MTKTAHSNVYAHPRPNTALARLTLALRDYAADELRYDRQYGPKFTSAVHDNRVSEMTQRLWDAALAASRADAAARLALDYLNGDAPHSLPQVLEALQTLINTGTDAAHLPDDPPLPPRRAANTNVPQTDTVAPALAG